MKLSVGTKIALSIVLAGGILVGWASIEGYRFLHTERGQELLRAARLAQESLDGPGSSELRDLGCEQAILTTFRELVSTTPDRHSADTLRLANATNVGSLPVVMCQDLLGQLLSCETVASTYAAATSPSQPFLVMVIRGSETRCGEVRSRAGEPLGPINAESLSDLEVADEQQD